MFETFKNNVADDSILYRKSQESDCIVISPKLGELVHAFYGKLVLYR